MTKIDEATALQNQAALPDKSTFVSANAGSGKTTILTNRIARLLFHNVDPGSILCLTYTKAAAVEVQARIFERLGEWVLLSDEELREKLRALGEHIDDAESLRNARRLFAQALETPVGLKIQTIHAFASSLLRRFPLEAGVSPHFSELSDGEIAELIAQAWQEEEMNGQDRALSLLELASWKNRFFDAVAQLPAGLTAKNIQAKMMQIIAPKLQNSQENQSLASICESMFAEILTAENEKILAEVFGKNLNALLEAKADGDYEEIVNILYFTVFTQKHEPRANFEKAKNKSQNPSFYDEISRYVERLSLAYYLVYADEILQFLYHVYERFSAYKKEKGALSFDDIIHKAGQLLQGNDQLNWVMYRLDGQIAHILVDEAQDTNEAQWRIIEALVKADFSAQQSRSLFVVGDQKQSIFSFQGANPEVFSQKQKLYTGEFGTHSSPVQNIQLQTSFRSSPIILNYVDKLYEIGDFGGVENSIAHKAFNPETPGKIEIYPFEVQAKKSEKTEWYDILPEVLEEEHHAKIHLANKVASIIADDIHSGKTIYEKGVWRAVHAGDYLILVEKRDDFFYAVLKALQEHQVPIQGQDRIKLYEELPIKDLIALMRFAAAPYDDLSFAQVMLSPIGQCSHADLFKIAYDRPKEKTLWECFEARYGQDDARVILIKSALANSDYLRPYDWLLSLLKTHHVEDRMRARFGDAVIDAIDAFLDQALDYETEEAPSLMGFVDYFDKNQKDVKREFSQDGKAVRVMTVHGAKGLEANIVFHPIIQSKSRDDTMSYVKIDDMPLPKLSKSAKKPLSQLVQERFEKEKQRRQNERHRLFYVALTRARQRLVLFGLGVENGPVHQLYQTCERALKSCGYELSAHKTPLEIRHHWQEESGAPSKAVGYEWGESLPPFEGKSVSPFALIGLSSLLPNDEAVLIGGRGAEFGEAVHFVMENFQQYQTAQGQDLAISAIKKQFSNINAHEAWEEAQNCFAQYPELSAPNAFQEVDFSLNLEGVNIQGRMDCLIMGDAIEIWDYKTQDQPSMVPPRYQLQLATYQEAMRISFPEKEIICKILWTPKAQVTLLDNQELAQHFQDWRQSLKTQAQKQ